MQLEDCKHCDQANCVQCSRRQPVSHEQQIPTMQAGHERGRRPWLTQEDPHDVALLVRVKSIYVAPMAVKVPRYSTKQNAFAAFWCLAVSGQVMITQLFSVCRARFSPSSPLHGPVCLADMTTHMYIYIYIYFFLSFYLFLYLE